MPEYLRYALWVGPSLMQAAILARCLYARLRREFPAFFWYTAAQVVRFAVLFGLYHWRGAPYLVYFSAYWLFEFLGAALGIAVAWEIYTHVFAAYPGLKRLGRLLFHWCAGLLLLLAVVVAASSPAPGFGRLVRSLVVLDMATMVVRAGLILFLFVFATAFRLSWRHYCFGIALGVGLYTTVEVAATAAQATFGSGVVAAYDVIRSVAYSCAVLIWLTFLLGHEESEHQLPRITGDEMRDWSLTLEEMLRR